MEIRDLIVLEFSPTQNCFHRHNVSSMQLKNIRACLRGTKGLDYLPIGIFETYEECEAFKKSIEPKIRPDGVWWDNI